MQLLKQSFLKKISLLVAIFLGTLSTSYALTISPARYDISADKGTTVVGEFTVTNEQGEDATFYSSVQNFEAQGESGTPNFTESKTGLAKWTTLNESVKLKKGEKKVINFSITVPNDADAGGHFAAIFLSTVPPVADGETGVSVGAKIGMLLLLRINGDIKEGGGILSFDTKDSSWFETELPVTFTYRFNNSGNDRVNPTGDIVVRNMLGLTATKLNANPTTGNILPGSTRKFDVAWGEETIDPSASFFEHVAHQMKNFAFGFYSAKMTLAYGTSGSSISKAHFFILPWQLMLTCTIIGVFLLLGFRIFIKRYNRWIIAQAKMHS